MSTDEIREIVKEQIDDPVPEAIMKVFKLTMQDVQKIGINHDGNPINRIMSPGRELGYYKTKLDAIMHMIEISPLAFQDGRIKEPIATTTVMSDIYEVYEIDLDNPAYSNMKTLYMLREIVLN